jgi:hypothetical protein
VGSLIFEEGCKDDDRIIRSEARYRQKTVEVQNSVRSGLRISLTHFPYSDGQNSAAGFATIRTRVPICDKVGYRRTSGDTPSFVMCTGVISP